MIKRLTALIFTLTLLTEYAGLDCLLQTQPNDTLRTSAAIHKKIADEVKVDLELSRERVKPNDYIEKFEFELEEIARRRRFVVSKDTKFVLLICGKAVVLGDKKYENAFRNILGIDAIRISYEVEDAARLAYVLRMLNLSPRIAGAVITQPWKIESLKILKGDEWVGEVDISDTAEKTGAINHITKQKDGSLMIDSIDGKAFMKAYGDKFPADWQEKGFTILGCGGAGREICFILADSGIKRMHLVELPGSLKKVRDLEATLHQYYPELLIIISTPDSRRFKQQLRNSSVIVNASDAGMNSIAREQTPFKNIRDIVLPEQVVIDIIISPDVTGLLEQAFLIGAAIYNGLDMARLTTVDHIFNWCNVLLEGRISITREKLLKLVIEHSRTQLGRLEADERLQRERIDRRIQTAA